MNAPVAALLDPALIAKYDVSGPRYTSYPTAPHFHERFGERELRAAIRESNADAIPRDLSVYVHVPFCTSPCFYCGCARIVTRDRGKGDAYVERLEAELDIVAPLFDRDRTLAQLHFGGGTPNFLGEHQIVGLIDTVARRFRCSAEDEREFGIELDPRHCDVDYVRTVAANGINRVSIGVQDFDRSVQVAVNRVQAVDEVGALIEAARAASVRSVNLDLIYGLPRQTRATFARTLADVVSLRPDRISAYGYAHLPERFKAQRKIDSASLPDASERLALLQLTAETLVDTGYVYVGMDHFALPDDDLARAPRAGTLHRNFQGYSTHAECDLIGLGMSAISHIGDTYSQNAKELPAYYAAVDARRMAVARGAALDADDRTRADAIQRLMCAGVIDTADFGFRHGVRFDDYFAHALDALAPLERDGLVARRDGRIEVTPRGRYFLRNVAMCFDGYLQDASVRYSKVL